MAVYFIWIIPNTLQNNKFFPMGIQLESCKGIVSCYTMMWTAYDILWYDLITPIDYIIFKKQNNIMSVL